MPTLWYISVFFLHFSSYKKKKYIFHLWRWTLLTLLVEENHDETERIEYRTEFESGTKKLRQVFCFESIRKIPTSVRIIWSIVVRKIKLFSGRDWWEDVYALMLWNSAEFKMHAGTRCAVFVSFFGFLFHFIFVLWSFRTTSCLFFLSTWCAVTPSSGCWRGTTKNKYTKHVRATHRIFIKFLVCNFCCAWWFQLSARLIEWWIDDWVA